MKLSPSQIKNLIRRSLRLLPDPDLDKTAKQKVWRYFQSRCAYCEKLIERSEGDMDHLVSGGANGLSNRVLSCKPCNAEQKRENPWIEFLREKCGGDEVVHAARAERIQSWVRMHKWPTNNFT
jgi:hypothetical protein